MKVNKFIFGLSLISLSLGGCSTKASNNRDALKTFVKSLHNYSLSCDMDIYYAGNPEPGLICGGYRDWTLKVDGKNYYRKYPQTMIVTMSISALERDPHRTFDEYISDLRDYYSDEKYNLKIDIDKSNDKVTISYSNYPDTTKEFFYQYDEAKQEYTVYMNYEGETFGPLDDDPDSKRKYEETIVYLVEEQLVKAVEFGVDSEDSTITYEVSSEDKKKYQDTMGEDNVGVPSKFILNVSDNKLVGCTIYCDPEAYNAVSGDVKIEKYMETYKITDVGTTKIEFPK